MGNISKDHIISLIEAGIQAPSADNGQPWKFKLLDDGFELWLDSNNMGLFFDVNQVASKISCGALIENVEMLANALGLKMHIEYFNKSSAALKGMGRFAKIAFTVAGATDKVGLVKGDIFNRHTNRDLFKFNKIIPDAEIKKLEEGLMSDDHFLHVYQSAKAKKTIVKVITATDTIRFIHQQIHNDFYKVLRFGKAAEKTRDGLAAATLGVESFMIPILQWLKPWKLTVLFNYVGLQHVMAFRGTWLPMTSASHIVAIVHKGEADYVRSGRVMQRFWLQANKLGLSVQPLGALPLFLARLHLVAGEGFDEGQLNTLKELEEKVLKNTYGFDKESDQMIMFFRLGYSKKPAKKAYRRLIESFFID